eukprot:g30534.t1
MGGSISRPAAAVSGVLVGAWILYLVLSDQEGQEGEEEAAQGTINEEIELLVGAEEDREEMSQFHIANNLAETVHYPGELKRQREDVPQDFPWLLSSALFQTCYVLLAREKRSRKLAGCVALRPDEKDKTVVWLVAWSVASKHRKKGLGTQLLTRVLQNVNWDGKRTRWVRLVTLKNHSHGAPIMQEAKRLYERFGFTVYHQDKNLQYGTHTTIDVVYYEKFLGEPR